MVWGLQQQREERNTCEEGTRNSPEQGQEIWKTRRRSLLPHQCSLGMDTAPLRLWFCHYKPHLNSFLEPQKPSCMLPEWCFCFFGPPQILPKNLILANPIKILLNVSKSLNPRREFLTVPTTATKKNLFHLRYNAVAVAAAVCDLLTSPRSKASHSWILHWPSSIHNLRAFFSTIRLKQKNGALAPKLDPNLGFFSQPYSKNSDQKLLRMSADLVFAQINSTRQQNLFLFRNESASASNKPSLHSLSLASCFFPPFRSVNQWTKRHFF